MAGRELAIERRRGELGGVEHRPRVRLGAAQVAPPQPQPGALGVARGEQRGVAGAAALRHAGVQRDLRLRRARRPTRARSSPARTRAGRSGRAPSAGPAASARRASAAHALGRLVGVHGDERGHAEHLARRRRVLGGAAHARRRRAASAGAVAASSMPAPSAIDSSSAPGRRRRRRPACAAARSITSTAGPICSARPSAWASTSAARSRTPSSRAVVERLAQVRLALRPPGG